MQNSGMNCVGLVGLLLGASTLGGCSDAEGIAVGAAIGALTGYAVSSLDDGDVRVHSYSYTSYGYAPRWHGYSRWDGWGGYSTYRHYGHWDRGWGWRGPRSPYRCDY
ncbi:MAG: hypothetical protein DYG94_12020 [Leptolyngbya sp. PLA3]|nr:MAG: hypothetical protein EDM82_05430 [Cyanobacteria bacterium CYA]MCE7969452.1 hypothetical protein [Leptolyngbya sp. PL-A3]